MTGQGRAGVPAREPAPLTLRQRAGALFPLDADGRSVRWRIALSIAFFLAAAALSLARQGGPGALDSIWAEDGSHYQFTFNHSAFHTLFTPVNGYLLLVQRLVLSVIAIFPIAWAAALMAIAGGLASAGDARSSPRGAARSLRAAPPAESRAPATHIYRRRQSAGSSRSRARD